MNRQHPQAGAGNARQTQRFDATNPTLREASIASAAAILAGGGLVAFPTETVYGLGANAFNEKAIRSIFAAKGRPADNPLIVHVSAFEEAFPLVHDVPETAHVLARELWPGPLTLVLPAKAVLPPVVTAGLDTVGIRVPGHEIARDLIAKAGVPVAAPSANASGSPSPTTADHVLNDLDGRIDAVLDGGPCRVGVESTVVDLSGPIPVVLRPGGVPAEELLRLAPNIVIPPVGGSTVEGVPKAPGMKYRHYAPATRLLLVEGEPQRVVDVIHREIASWQARGNKVAVLAAREHAAYFRADVVSILASRRSPEEAAHNLFGALRDLDHSGVDVILVEGLDSSGIGRAVMNRLWKASGGEIIHAR